MSVKGLTPEIIEQVRLLYAGNELTNIEIGRRFGKAPNWVNHLAAKYKWPLRGKHWRPGLPHGGKSTRSVAAETRGGRRQTASQIAETTAQNRAAEEAAYRARYGDVFPDVQLLQKRGFVVTARDDGTFDVGRQNLNGGELTAKANRERRLAGADPGKAVLQTASGLKVGDSVPIAKPAPVSAAAQRRLSTVKQKELAAELEEAVAPARRLSGAAAIAKAKAAEHSVDLGARPRMEWIDKVLLQVDHRYQRDVAAAGQAHVNRILKGFNWNCYQPIIVCPRDDGTYAVIDGQHRLEAARKHPLIGELPAYVVDAPTLAAQAAIFSTVNGRRLGLTSLQKFWAAHAAGEESAVAVQRICKAHDVTILRGIPSYDIPARSVLAPFTLQKMLARVGREAVDEAIGLLAETQGDKLNAFRSPTLVALSTIAAAKGFNRDRWARVLRRLDIQALYDEARTDRVTAGGTLETATERALRKHAGKAAK